MEDNETKNVDPLVLLLKTEGIEDTNAGEKEQSEFMDEWLDDSFVTRSEEFLQENASPENMFSNETEEIQTFHVEVKKGVTFQCKYCKRIFEKGAFYQKQLNRYIFKCDLPNCTQVAQNFMVLRKHHEASCPKNPNYVNWRPRQKVRKEKVNKSISEDSVVSIESNLLLEHGSEADQNARKFNATNFSKKMPDLFRCQYCHQEYTKQRFFQQKHNRYFFKCDLPNCFQVAQNFRVFSMHHEASCPKNPSCSKWKRRQKSVNDLNEQIGNGNAKGDLMQDEAQSQPKYDPWFAENVFSDARSTTKIVRTLIGPGKAKNIFLNSFQCKYCLKEYKKANYFQRQSGKFVFKCELPGCTKVTKNFVVFRQHHQASCPSKPFEDGSFFECKYCKGKYQKSNYYNPETKRFIFKCDQPGCSVIAQNFPVFRKHHEATCPEKPTPTAETFCCGICDKQFASMKTLQNHQIVFHTRNYSYFCDKCGTGAVSLTALNVHMLMHSERKYTCAACPASFRRKQHLRNHELRLHSQNLPHMCDTCGKRFSVRQGLRMHLQNMHGISGTGVCPICKKTFKSPHYVRNHIWSTHRKLRKPKSQSLKSRVDLAGTEANKLLDRLEIELGDENSVSAVSAFSTSSPDNVVTVGF
ncbi:unnamed protein product [Allacma fusca]|uniref:C2H2-type domain-containing protein n=1 Tax=Allacma fusca TaxID=39272 RepID=A0A8J2J676_9HEXA|nr:unnamed protein product [Allacma fusca]